MTTQNLQPGQSFPAITVEKLGGGYLDLSQPSDHHDWRLLVVYRGKHCPLCTKYLRELNQLLPDLNTLGIDVAAGKATAISYGRPFIANPDLPERFRIHAPLNDWDPNTFYGGDQRGYTDYPCLSKAGELVS